MGQNGGVRNSIFRQNVNVRQYKFSLRFCAFNYRSLAEMAAATSVHVVTIIEPIIQHADWFFPEGVNLNVKYCFLNKAQKFFLCDCKD